MMLTKQARSLFFVAFTSATNAFLPAHRQPPLIPCLKPTTKTATSTCQRMSFVADSSDYESEATDYAERNEDEPMPASPRSDAELADVPVTEEIPVPRSRNNVGNRFVALVFDRSLSTNEKKGAEDGSVLWKMHHDRVALTEEHVTWTRKQNLYSDTFNTESMADVLWSRQLLSADLQRTIGHAMCLDAPTIEHCREALSRDPIVRMLQGVDAEEPCNVSPIPLYRWRQIRDHTLRRDDGRDGLATMVLAFDRPEARTEGVREEIFRDHLEYLIRSESVISAGPLHVATKEKTDPKSVPVGTLLFVNAVDRDNAIEFVENDPAAMAGLYETMTVHRYNNLDVTGKFVSENCIFPRQNTCQMKEAMGHWGYPVEDDDTKWLNW